LLAFGAGVVAIVILAVSLRLYMQLSGVTRIAGSGIAVGFLAMSLVFYNLAAAFVLGRFATLEGPVEHDP
jgi:hypothetical protein